MRNRIIVALIGIPIILFAVFANPIFLSILTLLLIGASAWEVAEMYGQYQYGERQLLINIVTIIAACSFLLFRFLGFTNWMEVGLIAIFIALVVFTVALYPQISWYDLAFILFGAIYTGWTFTHMYALRLLPNGSWLLLLVFVIIWSSDSFAYFTGMRFGKRKLAPSLSPNKTIEGALGGILGAVILTSLVHLPLNILPWPQLILLTVIAAIFGILGDLFESFIKRSCGVKDSGRILMEHGGILDRFDAFIFVLPLVTYILAGLQS